YVESVMKVFRALAVYAVCLIGLAHPAPLAAQAPAAPAEGNVTIYNLDSASPPAGIAIDGPIDKTMASRAVELIRFLRPDHDEVTVYLNSPGGDASAAIEIGQEVKKLSLLAAMDEHAECRGACVLVLAAGARRSPMPDKVGLYRLGEENPAPAKRGQTYVKRKGQ